MNDLQIIAEIGVNHNGKINLAKKLIDAASRANADYVKFQFYKVEELVSSEAKLANYQKKNLKKNISQKAMLKKYELNINQIKELLNYSKKKKINFLCTPFDVESAKELNKIGIKEFKIASPDIDNFPLLDVVSKFAKKIFISTGMSTLKDIANILAFLKKKNFNKKNLHILHCTSDYPAQKKELNLLAIKLIKKKFRVNVGYSDHSIGELASTIAVTLGAKIIEKHITLDNKMEGPDHLISLNKKNLISFVANLREIKLILGKKIKKITQGEKKNFKLVKRSVFMKKDIKKGEFFNLDHFVSKRPRKKISSIKWYKLLNKKAKKNLKKGTLLNL